MKSWTPIGEWRRLHPPHPRAILRSCSAVRWAWSDALRWRRKRKHRNSRPGPGVRRGLVTSGVKASWPSPRSCALSGEAGNAHGEERQGLGGGPTMKRMPKCCTHCRVALKCPASRALSLGLAWRRPGMHPPSGGPQTRAPHGHRVRHPCPLVSTVERASLLSPGSKARNSLPGESIRGHFPKCPFSPLRCELRRLCHR